MGERLRGKTPRYLTHRKEFFSETFYVDERVLIPRPETELLVEEALSIMGRSGGATRVLDMGAGSGIIGILLAKKGARRVLSVDVSAGALEVAKANAQALSVAGRIDFAASDLFSSVKEDAIFDLVCANLPYVGFVEWDGLEADVRCFEPKEALLGGTAGFETLRQVRTRGEQASSSRGMGLVRDRGRGPGAGRGRLVEGRRLWGGGEA